MDDVAQGAEARPATAARMYDYYLGGIHNFPADREAAQKIIAQCPFIPAGARANRAFVRRSVGYLADVGIRQFLDLGSGIPTEGNVHEIAQGIAPDARVVYVDIDPVAVAESLDMLHGNDRATAIRADIRDVKAVLAHPQVGKLLDFDRPIGLILGAVLHFVPADAEAYALVEELVTALVPGSYLAVSHGASESFPAVVHDKAQRVADVYKRQTATLSTARTQAGVARFFTGRVEPVDPGVVWAPEWRPTPEDWAEFAEDPGRSCSWAGVGRIG